MLYTKEAVEKIGYKEGYYIPEKVLKNKTIRTELKWGYIALVNVMLRNNNQDEPCVDENDPLTIEVLKALANKKVDQAKIDGYVQELEDMNLVEIRDHKIYIEQL